MYRTWLYRHAPVGVQEWMIDLRFIVEGLVRRSPETSRYTDEVNASQWFTPEKIHDLQRSKLDMLIDSARRGSPYWRQRFLDYGIMSSADVQKLPLLTREELRSHASDIVNRRHLGPTRKGTTSGTSGTPVRIAKSLTEIRYETAFYQRQLDWAGYRSGDRLVWLRGDPIVDPTATQPPYWRHSSFSRTLLMSSYHLSPGTAHHYVAAMEAFRPAIIQAYPSSAAFLARYLESVDRHYGGELKGIVTSSETLTPEDRQLIEARFGCRIFNWYGSYERVSAIGTCEHGRYHLLTDYSFSELVPDEDGDLEIVGTNFNNLAFPLVRYRTSDNVIKAASDSTCPCGRHFPVVDHILGRQDDYVVTPSGRRVTRLGHIFKEAQGLLEAKIVQNRPSHLCIQIVTTPDYSPASDAELLARTRELTGHELEVEIQRVQQIRRGPRGKHQLVERTI